MAQDSAATRQKIIDAATRLYRSSDYEKITISMLLKETGLSKGGFYWYFSSKEALFHEIFCTCAQEMSEVAREGNDPSAPAVEQLALRQKNMLRYDREHPNEAYFVLDYMAYLKRNHIPSPYAYDDVVMGESAAILRLGIERGELQDFPLDFMVAYVWQKSNLLYSYLCDHPEYWNDTHLLDRMVDSLLSVLVRRPACSSEAADRPAGLREI